MTARRYAPWMRPGRVDGSRQVLGPVCVPCLPRAAFPVGLFGGAP